MWCTLNLSTHKTYIANIFGASVILKILQATRLQNHHLTRHALEKVGFHVFSRKFGCPLFWNERITIFRASKSGLKILNNMVLPIIKILFVIKPATLSIIAIETGLEGHQAIFSISVPKPGHGFLEEYYWTTVNISYCHLLIAPSALLLPKLMRLGTDLF